MNPQELIDAVRPCLPLGNIIDASVDIPTGWICWTTAEDANAYDEAQDFANYVIGAIAQACAERGWTVHATVYGGKRYVSIIVPFPERDYGWRLLGESPTIDALGWCRAYAQAKNKEDNR